MLHSDWLMIAVQDIVFQLQRLVNAMARYHNDCHGMLKEADVFPIEVDLARGTFTYETTGQINDEDDDYEDDEEAGVLGQDASRQMLPPAQQSQAAGADGGGDGNLISMN